MQPTTNDIVPPFDPTALTTMSFAQLYQLVSGLSPYSGIGFNIATDDVGTTPTVPNVPATGKWQYYLWLRRQTSSAVVYIWNPSAASDVTYLQWQSITAASIPDGSVTNSKLADNAVNDRTVSSISASKITGLTSGILPGTNIPAGDLAYDATTNPSSTYGNPIIGQRVVTGVKIALVTITSDLFAPGAVGAASLADGSVTTAKLADNAVTTVKITDRNVTAAKLALVLDLSAFTLTLPPASVQTALATGKFTTTTVPLASGTLINVTHGLTSPTQFEYYLINTAADGGYSVGDIIPAIVASASDVCAFSVGINATNTWCAMASTVFALPTKTTGISYTAAAGKWSVFGVVRL